MGYKVRDIRKVLAFTPAMRRCYLFTAGTDRESAVYMRGLTKFPKFSLLAFGDPNKPGISHKGKRIVLRTGDRPDDNKIPCTVGGLRSMLSDVGGKWEVGVQVSPDSFPVPLIVIEDEEKADAVYFAASAEEGE